MRNKHIAIIDDEEDARIVINAYLDRYVKTPVTIIEADNVVSGIELIKSEKPDIVFLDVQLTDGTGFDILKSFPDRTFKTIFTTGYDEYAIKAFKYSAVDYLLKPIDPEDFQRAIDKLEKLNSVEDLNIRINHLETLAAEHIFTKMAFPTKEGTIYIELSDIVNLISDGNYTTISTKNQKEFVVTRIIKEFEEMLPIQSFFRTHKSHIVNLQHIREFRRSDESLILSNGQVIPIARRRKENLMKILG